MGNRQTKINYDAEKEFWVTSVFHKKRKLKGKEIKKEIEKDKQNKYFFAFFKEDVLEG